MHIKKIFMPHLLQKISCLTANRMIFSLFPVSTGCVPPFLMNLSPEILYDSVRTKQEDILPISCFCRVCPPLLDESQPGNTYYIGSKERLIALSLSPPHSLSLSLSLPVSPFCLPFSPSLSSPTPSFSPVVLYALIFRSKNLIF